jgi:multidrug efflux pump subunit AcrA (membrane-fusion protein)
MHRSVKISLSLGMLFALALLAYTYLPTSRSQSDAAPAKPAAEKPAPIHVTTVKRGTISHQTTATGDILAAARVVVFSKVEGRLQTLRTEQGDTVQANQVIAQIDDAELKARRERAAAELDALRAEWAQMQAGPLPEEIAQAEDTVRQTKAELANAERLSERSRAMAERGLQSTQDLEDTALRLTRARAAHSIAEKRLVLLRAGARAEDRQALQARLRAAQAALRLAEAELQNAVITAPISGVISHRHVDPGAYIADNTAMVTIVDMDTVKISTPISERDIGRIQPGLRARIRVDAYPEDGFAGTVQRVSPTIDPASRSGEVEIVVANAGHRLKPGMFAKVTLILQQKHDVLVIPRAALRMSEKGAAVFVVHDDKAHLRQVTLGLQNDTEVEILDGGLTPGTDIVLAGHHGLKHQAPVKVVQTKE